MFDPAATTQESLKVPGGAGVRMTQQDTAFPAEGHALATGTAQNLHRALMGGNPMLHNTGVVGNGIGETTSPVAAPPLATVAG